MAPVRHEGREPVEVDRDAAVRVSDEDRELESRREQGRRGGVEAVHGGADDGESGLVGAVDEPEDEEGYAGEEEEERDAGVFSTTETEHQDNHALQGPSRFYHVQFDQKKHRRQSFRISTRHIIRSNTSSRKASKNSLIVLEKRAAATYYYYTCREFSSAFSGRFSNAAIKSIAPLEDSSYFSVSMLLKFEQLLRWDVPCIFACMYSQLPKETVYKYSAQELAKHAVFI
ncbi:hypothetical protein G2W53_044486 [Senna tora]|uniref:Uncharacterized protein n=1 Tax=Senna tora TaxID=362788 RepID=A0A834VX01_9FABA|nr:hypothetical protein G2W53_044486 [Senna tora]